MKHPLLLPLCLFSLCLISSCDDDSFSQIVNIPIPEHEPLPALSLELIAGDTAGTALLDLSFGILEERPTGETPNTIQLFKDDVLIGESSSTLNQNQSGITPLLTLSEPITGEQAEYRLVGTMPEIGTATATQIMPAVANVEIASYTEDGALDADGFRLDELILNLNDNGATTDYYAFRVSSRVTQINCFDQGGMPVCDTFTYDRQLVLSTPDPLLLGAGERRLALRDPSFSGTTYQVRLQFDALDQSNAEEELTVSVLTLTEDAYRYMVSLSAYRDAIDNPFAEPINVHSNIENGYGYFILANERELAF